MIINVKNIRKLLIVILAVSVMLLSSCAQSPVVRVISPDAKTVAQQVNSLQKDPSKNQQAGSDESNFSDGQYKNDNKGNLTTSGQGQQTDFGQSGGQDGTAFGNGQSGGNSNGSGVGTGNEYGSGIGGSSGTGTGKPTGKSSDPGNKPKNIVFSPVSTQQINYPYDGSHNDTPVGVKTVAAAGIYADMVEMMGGTLVATSQDNLNNNVFTTVFKKDSGAKPYMPSQGQAMTAAQATALAKLPASQRPQTVVCDSSTFNGDQGKVAQNILTNANIRTLLMEDTVNNVGFYGTNLGGTKYAFDPFTMVLHNVYYIGQMLKDKCKVSDGQKMVSADKMSKEFEDYYLDKINGHSSSLHSRYPYSQPENAATKTQYVDGVTINTPDKDNIDRPASLQEYWSNLEFATGHDNWAQYIVQNKTVNHPTGVSDDEWNKYLGQNGRYNYYGTNYRLGLENNFFTSSCLTVNVENPYTNIAIGSYIEETFYNKTISPGYISNIYVGNNSNSPNDLIVKSQYDPNGQLIKLLAYGMLDDNRTVYPTNKYINLHVQPVGVHSWTSGAPESFLEPLWLATIFQSGSNVNIRQTVHDFYSKFYHYNLNDTQLNQILKKS